MSYASEVKKELTAIKVHRDNAKAELMALIRMNGSIGISNHHLVLNIQTENPAIARRIYSLLKDFYHVESEIVVRRKMKLKKNNQYIVRLRYSAERVLDDLQILQGMQIKEQVPVELLKDEWMVRSYLRGAFLAGGSVNNPETSRYHLEIYSLYEEHNEMIARMMNKFGLNAQTTARRSGYIVYLKEAEKIANFMSLIGATNSMLQFENIKLIEASVGLESLPDKLREIAETRLAHQEVSLKELGELVPGGPISKSGVNHRLRKLNAYADELRNRALAK